MVELVGNIPDDVVLQARLDILYGQTPDITIKAHELPEESEPTVEKSGTLAKPVFNIGIPQAMGAVAAREYAKQAETARDAAILAGENAKEELNGIVASADDALDQKIAETGTLLDEKVATAAQRASDAASSAVAAAQKATAAEQAMQGAQAAQVQAEQSAQEAAENTAMAKDFASGQPVTYSGTPVSIAYAGAQRIAAITAYGETPQGGTTEAPVALTGVDSVQVCGNNLLPNKATTGIAHGVSYTVNTDGSITAKGTATTWASLVVTPNLSLPAGTYTLTAGALSSETILVIARNLQSEGSIVQVVGGSKTFSIAEAIENYIAFITVSPGNTVDFVCYPMLNLGSTAMPYETYQGSVTPIPIPRPLRRVGDVKDKCVTRQDYESAEKLVVTYNLGFVELDGTETSHLYAGIFYLDYSAAWPTPANRVNGVCSHYPYGPYSKGKIGLTDNGAAVVYNPNGDYTGDEGGLANWKAYLAAQKEAGTPVQVAYQLATPETYATDPLDIDNAAGPLTVLTGGELEVRMTELVGMRSDVSNNTVAFTETAQDADIASGEKLSVLFGKIKKRFSAMLAAIADRYTKTEAEARFMPNLNLLDNSDFTNLVNQRGEAVYDYLTGIGYGPDRWQLVEAKYTLASQTVTSAGSSHTYGSQLRQIIPLEKIKIGDTVTASISTESGILNGTAKLELKIDTSVSDFPYVIEQDWGGVKIGCIKENVCHVIVFLKENKSVKINWVKLEKGSVATPYVPKGYGAELSECLRYFYSTIGVWTRIVTQTQYNGALQLVDFFPVTMRIAPTLEFNGTYQKNVSGATVKPIEIGTNDVMPIGFSVYIPTGEITTDFFVKYNYTASADL